MAERKIGGVAYKVDPLYAKRALALFARVGKVVGPAMPELVHAIGSNNGTAEAAAKAFSRVMSDVDPEKFADLVEELVETVQIKSENGYTSIVFDQEFTGNLQGAVKVVGFALQEHFGSFFTAILADMSGVRKAG